MTNQDQEKKLPDLSVIIPVYNEAKVLAELFDRLNQALSSITADFEVIFAIDGCTDNSVEIIESFHQRDRRYKYLVLSRQHGQEIAIAAGLDFAEGRAVVIIDADLQDPPELIPALWAKWQEGIEVVYARREKREKGFWLKSLGAKCFYRLMNKFSPMKIPEDTGNFRLLDRQAVLILRQTREASRYLRGLSVWIGFKQGAVYFKRGDRSGGQSHNNFVEMFKIAFDAITAFSIVPLRLATYSGLVCAGLGFVGILWVIIVRFLPNYNSAGWATIVVAILFLGGVQLLVLGLIGEYIGRIYKEVQRRPLYVISQKKGFDAL
ncbi:MAG: glycosyltransferase family 2 protein [bacterium]